VTQDVYSATFGDLAGADNICANEATRAKALDGRSFVAWLSTSSEDARARLGNVSDPRPIVRIDGMPVAATLATLVSTGVLENPIELDPLGNVTQGEVWTGTDEHGVHTIPDPEHLSTDCDAWTNTSSPPAWATLGNSAKTTAGFSNDNYFAICGGLRRLYCFQK
jgi:hypothetical protein